MHSRQVFLIGAAIALTVASPVSGDVKTRMDADDNPGRLDVRSAMHAHKVVEASGQRLLRHRIETYEGWRSRILDGGSTSIHLFFNTDDDGRPERSLSIDRYEGALFAEMKDPFDDESPVFGYALVWRPNRSRIAVQFPVELLGPGVDSYRWYVQTNFNSPQHARCGDVGDVSVVCIDRAPSRRTVLHNLV